MLQTFKKDALCKHIYYLSGEASLTTIIRWTYKFFNLKQKTTYLYRRRSLGDGADESSWLSLWLRRFSSCCSAVAWSRCGWVCWIWVKSWPTGDSSWRGATGIKSPLKFPEALTIKLLALNFPGPTPNFGFGIEQFYTMNYSQ